MIWWAIGSIVMFVTSMSAAGCLLWRGGYASGYEAHKLEMAENRAARRAEARARVTPVQREPFPEEWTERLASTGELRVLAETGDIAALQGHVAAFFRNLDLHGWTRKRGTHAA